MSDFELRFRQIHLDFHTSEAIEGIGANFDPDEFADTLDKACVIPGAAAAVEQRERD